MANLGTIPIPEFSPDPENVFPLTRLDYGGYGVSRQASIATHTFNAANRKVSQRFVVGNGARKITIGRSHLTATERADLLTFWEGLGGAWKPFFFNAPNEDGTTTQLTCVFEQPSLTFEALTDCIASVTLTLVVVPDTVPQYAISATLNRLPSAALNDKLLDQVQEIIPLIKIIPLADAGNPIYVSDRKVTVGGITYEPRILDWNGISQSIGDLGSDEASFVLGNADRVFSQLVNATDLFKARLEFSLFHVATTTKLDLWAGDILDWAADATAEFRISASDGLYELRLGYPERKVSRTCWKTPGSSCPLPAGTACARTWAACVAHGQQPSFGGILAQPQTVNLREAHWHGSRSITSSSIVSDSVFGAPLPEIYTTPSFKTTVKSRKVEQIDEETGKITYTYEDVVEVVPSDFPVDCLLSAGRDESEFYAALGIVGRGPLDEFGDGHTLDNQPHHGPNTMGLRTSLGEDPNTDSFSLSETGKPAGPDRAAGTAFIEIRRTDEKDLQLSKLTEHTMRAMVRNGLKGWTWTGPGQRAEAKSVLSNPVWIAVNMLLRARRVFSALPAVQEALFDVPAAIAAATVCNTEVAKMVGAGNETQYTFRGVLRDDKPLRDWLTEVLNSCLGYYLFSFGKLKIGLRADSATKSAFTEGNVVADSVSLAPLKPSFNHITVEFGSSDLDFANDAFSYFDADHIARIGTKLESKINLVGCSTRSHAARFGVTRVREELGGVGPAEWTAARQIAFRTTILALETEPGMVCSLTHPDMPGGAGEFRILRWKLNKDFSIDIEGRSTTDATYNLLAGVDLGDIGAEPIPVESPYTVVPPVVQLISATPEHSDPDKDGKLWTTVKLKYKPPVERKYFAGIRVYTEAPEFSSIAKPANPDVLIQLDTTKLPGNKERISAKFPFKEADLDALGYVTVVLPKIARPKNVETWRCYGCSFSATVESKLVTLPADPHSPTITFQVDPATATVGQGEEYAPRVTSPAGSIETRFSEGAWQYRHVLTWTDPDPAIHADKAALFTGVQVTHEKAGAKEVKKTIAKGVQHYTGEWKACPLTPEEWISWLPSVGTGGVNSIVPGVTPSVKLTVSRPSGTPGLERTSVVSGFSVAKHGYTKNAEGQKIYEIDCAFTVPDDPTWTAAVFKVIAPGVARTDISKHITLGTFWSSPTHSWFTDFPTAPEDWIVYAVSKDAQDQCNSYVQGVTPETTITVQPPNRDDLADASGFTMEVGYGLDKDGLTKKLFTTPNFTIPADPAWNGVELWAYVREADYWSGIGWTDKSDDHGELYVAAEFFPTVTQHWDFILVSVDVNGKRKRDPRTQGRGDCPAVLNVIIAPPNDAAPHVIGFTAQVDGDEDTADGVDCFGFSGTVTPPDDARYKGAVIWARLQGSNPPVDRNLATLGQDTTFHTDQWPKPAATQTWDLYAVPFNALNSDTNSGIVPGTTPCVAGLVVAPSAAGTLKGNRINPVTLGTPFTTADGKLDILYGGIKIDHIDTAHINITDFAGNVAIERISNLAEFNVGNFAGNLNFDRVDNLGQFNIGSFAGVITTQQVQDGFLADLKKFAAELRPITRVATLPALPNDAYPVDTIVLNAADSKLYKNAAGTWTPVSASDTITGKLSSGDILSVAAATINGQINAGVITHVAVSQFAGTLSAAQANAISISAFNGNLDVSRVANINTLNIANLQGNLDVSRVANIGTLNIGSFTGTLLMTQVTDGSITSAKIASLDVSKLNAGTMNVGTGGITFSGGGGIALASGGNLWVNPGYVSSYGGYVVASMGTNYVPVTVIDTNAVGNFVSLKVYGSTRIDSAGNGYFANIYTRAEVDTLISNLQAQINNKAAKGTYYDSSGDSVTL